VRELENAIERATNLAMGEWIQPGDLPLDARPRITASPHAPQPTQELSSHEMHAIVTALTVTGGNIRLAAQQLKVSRGGLYNNMSRFGLNVADFRRP
jgi:DNA-binding NtrC family response regulator